MAVSGVLRRAILCLGVLTMLSVLMGCPVSAPQEPVSRAAPKTESPAASAEPAAKAALPEAPVAPSATSPPASTRLPPGDSLATPPAVAPPIAPFPPLDPPTATTSSPPAELPSAPAPLALPPGDLPAAVKPTGGAGFLPNPLRPDTEPPANGTPEIIPQPEAKPAAEPKALPSDPTAQPVEPKVVALPEPKSDPKPETPQSKPRPVEPLPRIAADRHEALVKPEADKGHRALFDPVKENGPIFEGWPKPKLALVMTGRQDGYLEPCGCAGLDRMKGGMTRRYTMLKTLRDPESSGGKGWPVVALDVGGIAKGTSPQALLKFQIAVEGMRKMGFDAIGLGKPDLQLSAADLLPLTLPVNNQPSPFVSANVALFAFDEKNLPQMRIVEAGGKKVGVTAVLGKSVQKEINDSEIKMIDPEAALEKIVPALKKAKPDCMVLMVYARKNGDKDADETAALARKFPVFDFVLTADGGEVPPDKAAGIPGTKSRRIEVGAKGMYAVVLGLFDDPRQPVRYQRVPLDSRFPASKEMKALMKAYQDQVVDTKILANVLNNPKFPPQKQTNGGFVGSKACQSCHEESYKVWKKSGHSHAYDTLVKADPPRNFDPECISCHVIGWHPTQFFRYQGGFRSKEETPQLTDVGCENCHGPGEKHVAAEQPNGAKDLRKQFQQAMRITKDEAANPNSKKSNCWSCHDLDNSPDFNFERYWPKVEHHE